MDRERRELERQAFADPEDEGRRMEAIASVLRSATGCRHLFTRAEVTCRGDRRLEVAFEFQRHMRSRAIDIVFDGHLTAQPTTAPNARWVLYNHELQTRIGAPAMTVKRLYVEAAEPRP